MAASVISILEGTWLLLNTSTALNGVSIPDSAFGSAPAGILKYSASGYMSATLNSMDSVDRPVNLTFPFQATDPVASWAWIGEHALAYAGPFHINEDLPFSNVSGQVLHGPLLTATIPSFIGGTQVRNYTLFEDFTLLNIKSSVTGGIAYDLWWERLD